LRPACSSQHELFMNTLRCLAILLVISSSAFAQTRPGDGPSPASSAESWQLQRRDTYGEQLGGSIAMTAIGAGIIGAAAAVAINADQSASSGGSYGSYSFLPSLDFEGVVLPAAIGIIGLGIAVTGLIWLVVAVATHRDPPPIAMSLGGDSNGGWLTLGGSF
jgi:hypothetical protein